jgi:uncharacterized phage-like protein YoqJ
MELDITKTACFTGLRTQKFRNLTSLEAAKIALRRMISRAQELGYDTFISGMAIGVDTWAALAVLDAGSNLIAAVPCQGQERLWRISDQLVYREILAAAHQVCYVSDRLYFQSCMEQRNRWMIDHSSLVLAIWDGQSGGTANAIRYAKSLGRTIAVFNPMTAEYSKLN